MRAMPVIETERLRIRPFTIEDSEAAYQNSKSIGWVNNNLTEAEQRTGMQKYIQWNVLNHQQLAQLDQPPYGDRAIVLKENNLVIGTCGLVPYIDNFTMFPYFSKQKKGFATAEMGLLWTIAASHQKTGYGSEVAQALIQYAFGELNLHHIIATTEFDNWGSQRVMEKAGMWLERNETGVPPWLQVIGIAENPQSTQQDLN